MERLTATALGALALMAFTVVLKASGIAWNLWFLQACPDMGQRIYEAYTRRPVRAVLVGLLNSVAILILALILAQAKPLGLLAVGLAAALCTIHLSGRSACYRVLAEQLDVRTPEPPSAGALARAGVLTELAFLVPLAGQLLYLGITMRCAGAFILALFPQSRVQDRQSETPPLSPVS